jgi:hypothetical protein
MQVNGYVLDGTLYKRAAQETEGTKGRRKKARREVRNVLGVSSDPAPTLAQALDAVEQLRRIVDTASNGRYGLAIVRPTFPGEETQKRYVEQFTFDSQPGVRFEGDPKTERSSLVHEPVTETRRRERELLRKEGAR